MFGPPPQTYHCHQIYGSQQKTMKSNNFEFRANWPGLAAMTWEELGPPQVANAFVIKFDHFSIKNQSNNEL